MMGVLGMGGSYRTPKYAKLVYYDEDWNEISAYLLSDITEHSHALNQHYEEYSTLSGPININGSNDCAVTIEASDAVEVYSEKSLKPHIDKRSRVDVPITQYIEIDYEEDIEVENDTPDCHCCDLGDVYRYRGQEIDVDDIIYEDDGRVILRRVL